MAEEETIALQGFVAGRPRRASSLVLTELPRAVARRAPGAAAPVAELLRSVALVDVDRRLLRDAGALPGRASGAWTRSTSRAPCGSATPSTSSPTTPACSRRPRERVSTSRARQDPPDLAAGGRAGRQVPDSRVVSTGGASSPRGVRGRERPAGDHPAAPPPHAPHHAATSSAADVAHAGRVRGFLRLVVVEHSVFALPFAYVAALAAMREEAGRVLWGDLLLITLAMVGARTLAMASNRLIDRELDARNPRTASRELVTGAVSVTTARAGAGVALVVFLLAAGLLDPLCLALAPLAVAPLIAYPYAKRITWAPHAVLALAQAVAPVGAWLAVTGSWSWTAVLLGLGVGLWIGGFDLIYACQDVDSDRREGVGSYPARFGVAAALTTARVVHAVTFALFVAFGLAAGLGALWYVGLALTAAAFVHEHSVVAPDDLSRVDRSFFTTNGFVGIALGGFAVADLLVGGLALA